MRLRQTIVLAALCSVCACSRPFLCDTFVPVQDKQGGFYSFTLDLSDSLGVYDLFLYTGIDGSGRISSVPLSTKWISPDGSEYSENALWIAPGAEGVKTRRDFFSTQVLSPYRTAFRPDVYGEWTLKVACNVPGMRGMGVILKKEED